MFSIATGFSPWLLIPDAYFPTGDQVCFLTIPLFFRERHLGFALLEGIPQEYYLYDVLRGEISSALQGALLLSQIEEYSAKIRKLERDTLEIQMAGDFAHEIRNALAGSSITLKTVQFLGSSVSICQRTMEILEQVFQRLEPYIPEDDRNDIVDLFATIEQHEELIDQVLRNVAQGSRRALDVTALILEYARLGKTEEGTELLQLQHILKKLLDEHQTSFAQQGIVLTLAGDNPQTIVGHMAHFYSIFNNLLLNARDALLEVNDSRERRIDIILEATDRYQCVRISDTANGIPEAHIPKTFAPFFSTKPATGTGLGLNIVSKLVSLYQGTIEMESAEGWGTTFTVTFPLSAE